MSRKFVPYLFLITTVIIGFLFRINGIFEDHPFWVDEFATADQAKLALKYGLSILNNPRFFFESHNITTHFLVAVFFKFAGFEEWAARLPFVIIGSLVPAAVFILTQYIFSARVAISATLFTTFSYFQIVWSRQARAYVLVQLLALSTLLLYLKLTKAKKKSIWDYVWFIFLITLGIATHGTFYILIAALATHFAIFNHKQLTLGLKKPLLYIAVLVLIWFYYSAGLIKGVMDTFSSGFIKANNLWYYHSLLWREYGLIAFLAVIGALIALVSKTRKSSVMLIHIILQLFFVSFLFQPYTSRYLLPIFPMLFIFMAYSLVYLSDLTLGKREFATIPRYLKKAVPIFVTLAIIANGHKFVNRPKTFYSVNHDFREIALIDYHRLYSVIKEKGNIAAGETAVIDTWPARLSWYLGRDYKNTYVFRWIDEEGLVNGLPKKTAFMYNEEGEKVVTGVENFILIGELADLKLAMNKFPKGFIFIDDTSLPADVIEYTKENFKKELYLDHYTLDENPHSIWPATLYSWGIE